MPTRPEHGIDTMRISLITPSLNRAGTIAAALQSVVDQQDPDLEHLIIDGVSTDGTAELVRSRFPHATLVVEQDRNLYQALNRGLARCTGEVVGFLNTDDCLHPGALAAIRQRFAAEPGLDGVCGGCSLHHLGRDGFGQAIRVYRNPAMMGLRAGDIISGLILTNGRFFRRRVFATVGDFDDGLPVLADREFLARYHLAQCQTGIIDQVIYGYGCHADSLTFNGQISERHLREATLLARRGLRASTTPGQRAFFRLWHGWASGYEALHTLRRGQLRSCATLAAAAAKADWLCGYFFSRQLCWHLQTRSERSAA